MGVSVGTTAPPRRSTGSAAMRGARSAVRRGLYPLVTIAVVLAVWQVLVVVGEVSAVILPAPAQVIQALVSTFPLLLAQAGTTLFETLTGFVVAVLIGCPMGVLIVFSARARSAIYPLLVASQMVPKVALAPIFLVWFGPGPPSKLAVALLVAFFPIVVSTALGMESVDPDVVRLFRSMGASRMSTFLKLRLPSAAPSIFAGLKVAMTLAVVGALVGEFIAANTGLGYYILFQNGQLNTAAVYAAIVVVTGMGVALYFAVEALERLLSPMKARRRYVVGTTM